MPFPGEEEMPAFPSTKAKIKLPADVKGQQFPLHPCHVQVTRQALGASRLVRIIHLIASKRSILTLESKHSAFPGHKKLLWFSSSAKQQPPAPGSKTFTRTPKASSYSNHLEQLWKTHRADSFLPRFRTASSRFTRPGLNSPKETRSRAQPSSACALLLRSGW